MCDPSVGEVLELPVLVAAIGEVPADDKGDAALVELELGELVGLGDPGGRGDHEGRVLGDLQGAGAEHAGLLVLGHE